MANTRLDRTNGSPTNGQKGTFSTWVRVDKVAAQKIMINYLNSENYSYIRFHPSKFLQCYATLSNSVVNNYKTKRYFVDFNGWYHIVVRIDTTQANATDRLRLYINGELQTQYDTYTYSGSQNAQHPILIASATNTHRIGADENPADYFNGLMSHFHFCDGYSYDASAFGETDATTGEWKIKTDVSVTYGNNGYFILKDGNSVTDQSGNSNNFTVTGGTLTKTESSPSNVFATFNPLLDVNATPTFSNGNNTFVGTGSTNFAGSSIAVSSGKWYVEFKATTVSGSYPIIGVIDAQSTKRRDGTFFVGADIDTDNPSGFAVFSNGDIYHNNSNSYGNLTTTYTSGDVIGMALNMDSATKTLAFYKNGTLETTINLDEPPSGAYMFASGTHSSHSGIKLEANYGNGYFGTTAVSSAGTNASNNGIFEYDVPTGYTALSTRGLNT